MRETLGRKNFMFAGIQVAAQVNALIYYLVGTCMASGNNPKEWLILVSENIRDWSINRIEVLLALNYQLHYSK